MIGIVFGEVCAEIDIVSPIETAVLHRLTATNGYLVYGVGGSLESCFSSCSIPGSMEPVAQTY